MQSLPSLTPPPQPKPGPRKAGWHGGRQAGMPCGYPPSAGSPLSPPHSPPPGLDNPAFPFPCSLRFRFPWQPHPQLQAGEESGESRQREGRWGWGGDGSKGVLNCGGPLRTAPGLCVCRVLADREPGGQVPETRLSRGGHSRRGGAAPLPHQPDCPGKGSFDLLPETIAGNLTFPSLSILRLKLCPPTTRTSQSR